jgi:hypothetical protein
MDEPCRSPPRQQLQLGGGAAARWPLDGEAGAAELERFPQYRAPAERSV